MKRLIIAALMVAGSLQVFADEPNEKVLTAFQTTFQHVRNVTWTENQYSYEVVFQQDRISSRVTYDKQGNIVKTIRYYSQEQLPIIVLTKVKQKYPSKQIFGVVEESSAYETKYHITLEDETNWTMITADSNGYLKVDKKYKKA